MLRSRKDNQRAQVPILNRRSLKTAELSSRRVFAGSRCFPASEWLQMARFAPNVLVGSASELQRLIERIDMQTLDRPAVDHAIFVLTELGDKPLQDNLRLTLWQRFGVPVYEIYLGSDRQILARDCEAQEGWHVEPGVQFFIHQGHLSLQARGTLFPTGLACRLDTEPCPCGRPGLRILPPGAVSGAVAPLLAASA